MYFKNLSIENIKVNIIMVIKKNSISIQKLELIFHINKYEKN